MRDLTDEESWKRELYNLLFIQHDYDAAIKLRKKNIPKQLFHYSAISEHFWDSMKGVQHPDHATPHHAIWLSSPDSLNDPYDCWLHIDLKELGFDFELAKMMHGFGLVKKKDERIKRIIHYYATGCSDKTKIAEYKRELEVAFSKSDSVVDSIIAVCEKYQPSEPYRKTTYDLIQKKLDEIYTKTPIEVFKEYIKDYCVFSFCESNQDILMWSHYAKSHTGVCLEYNTNQLLGNPCAPNIYNSLIPIIYEKQPLDLKQIFQDRDIIRISGLLHEASMRKNIAWSYEKEWRFSHQLLPDTSPICDKRVYPFYPPTRIHLGLRMSKEDRDRIVGIANAYHIPVSEIRMDPTEYKLYSVPLEPAESSKID